MIAFVLSGGANYGALQAGALRVLLENGIHPDMLVGSSAGALNAAWLANDFSPRGARQLEDVWRQHAPTLYQTTGGLTMLVNLLQKRDGLLSNQPLQRLISKMLFPHKTFSDLGSPRLYMASVRLRDGKLYVFGDRPSERLLDGLMASTALTPIFPPWEVDGEAYADGGLFSNLPLSVAVERGATEIFALDLSQTFNDTNQDSPKGLIAHTVRAMSLVIERQVQDEIDQIRANPKVRLHHLVLTPQADPGFWNFSDTNQMIADGRRQAQGFLNQFHRQPRHLAAQHYAIPSNC